MGSAAGGPPPKRAPCRHAGRHRVWESCRASGEMSESCANVWIVEFPLSDAETSTRCFRHPYALP